MSAVAGIGLFLVLSPFLAGFMRALDLIIPLGLPGTEATEKSKLLKSCLKEPAGIFRLPWQVGGIKRMLAVSYPVFIMVAGALVFSGSNIAISFLLLAFSQAVRIYVFYANESESLENEPGVDFDPSRMEKQIAVTVMCVCQLLLIAAGFYCFNDIIFSAGNFSVSTIMSAGIAPALYMPAMLIGLVLILVYGFAFVHTASTFGYNEACKGANKEGALFQIGRSYKSVTVYGVLFIINYGGTAISAVISAAICLSVWFLSVLFGKNRSPQPGFLILLTVSAIVLLASFVNLFVLLS